MAGESCTCRMWRQKLGRFCAMNKGRRVWTGRARTTLSRVRKEPLPFCEPSETTGAIFWSILSRLCGCTFSLRRPTTTALSSRAPHPLTACFVSLSLFGFFLSHLFLSCSPARGLDREVPVSSRREDERKNERSYERSERRQSGRELKLREVVLPSLQLFCFLLARLHRPRLVDTVLRTRSPPKTEPLRSTILRRRTPRRPREPTDRTPTGFFSASLRPPLTLLHLPNRQVAST